MIDAALSLSLTAHRGQKDKSGKAYVLHPLRIMAKMTSEAEQCVALLHDVLEDSDLQMSDLAAAGLAEEVCVAVALLTRTEDQNYDDYIAGVANNPLARRVKIADIEDNINILRLRELHERDLARLKKYHRSWHRLVEA